MNWGQYLMIKKDLEETKQYLAALFPEMHASDKEEDMFITKRLSHLGEIEFVANYGGYFKINVVVYNRGGVSNIRNTLYVNGEAREHFFARGNLPEAQEYMPAKVNKNDKIRIVCGTNLSNNPNLDVRFDLYASATKVASDIK